MPMTLPLLALFAASLGSVAAFGLGKLKITNNPSRLVRNQHQGLKPRLFENRHINMTSPIKNSQIRLINIVAVISFIE